MAQTTARQFAHSSGQSVSNVVNTIFDSNVMVAAPPAFVLRSLLPGPGTAAITIGATAYFVFLGRLGKKISPQRVYAEVTVVGTSTQVGEVGLFSSPTSPNRAAQTLTCLMADGTLDSLTVGTGTKGNVTAFSTDVDAGTFLWAGLRVDMAGTEITVSTLTGDMGFGQILTLASAAVFTVGTTYAGVVPAFGAVCPNLVLHTA